MLIWCSGHVVVVLLVAALSTAPACTELIGLYEDSDLLEILDSTNFNDKVLQGNTSYVIEFYNAFCGHCIRFSTPWKGFGIQVYGWRNYVKVGVIDCSNEINSQTCRDYEVMAYPTVRYFPPRPASSNIGKDFIRSFNIQVMKDFLIKMLQETQSSTNVSTLCDIQPFENVNVEIDSNNILTFIIISTPNDKIAQELIIDFCPVKKVKIISVLNSNTGLAELLKTETYPSLYLVEDNNQFTRLASGNNKTNFTNTINTYLETVHMTPFSIFDITTTLYNLLFHKDKGSMHNDNTVYLSDLEATLRYSLEHEILSRSVISGESLNALNSYLELLIECFPSSIRGKKFIKLIWENTHLNKTVSGEKLGNLINNYEFLLKPYVTKHSWIGCEGSQPMYRKYPCGLWTMFHTLSVQASIKNLITFNGKQVLETIAGYVKHFFGCTDCSEHFMNMATTIQTNVSSLDDAVLWLWSAHNQVNQRLKGDVTEDPMHPKILFPSKVYCETCHQNGTDEWNKTEVLKYLKNIYSAISLQKTSYDNIHSQHDNLIITGKRSIDDNSNYNNNVFDEEEWKIDVSTCMISYILSCSVLMILFYLLLVKKRCKKNKYIYFILGK
ncbi:sulfhydryl oxidase 2-like [Metopolophium dirhodum]|uniref:sulfhydryl oxidase 2-like n=1 Tax=Metopolophium dirhodum TaxID=44670 RepID=UPI00298F6405|nr:sulfhydryl oxidase 2-like [Metopolophium dirhodum]XP_060875281.1 sulfhydryl oxidase 2-like [Metopolophium dirhodum]